MKKIPRLLIVLTALFMIVSFSVFCTIDVGAESVTKILGLLAELTDELESMTEDVPPKDLQDLDTPFMEGGSETEKQNEESFLETAEKGEEIKTHDGEKAGSFDDPSGEKIEAATEKPPSLEELIIPE